MRLVMVAFWLIALPTMVSAHHSISALFDNETVIEVEGELTRVLWRNPHVRFWVTSADGETWEIESQALGLLERHGIMQDLFVEGTVIRATGYAARRMAQSFYATNILLPDRREVLMGRSITPRWSDRTIDFTGGPIPIPQAEVAEAQRRADGIFRVWRISQGQRWTASLTPAAEAAKADWVASRDDPRLRCIAPGMVDSMASPYPIELVRDGGDIVIRMEEWDGIRRIHMGDVGEQGVEATLMGYSTGRWEDNTLVVSTNRINWPYFDNDGTPQSEAVEMVERFALSDDEQRMTWEAIITDSINLVEPAVVRQAYEWVPGEEVMEFDCVLPDEV